MPFAVFRRHQRKLMAVFAISAMFVFVLGDSVPNLIRSGGVFGGTNDPVVATLYGRKVRRSGLAEPAMQRNRANAFIARLAPGMPPQPFGGTTTKELVDARILSHEADELGIPATPEYANKWLNSVFGNALRPETFERVRRETFENVDGTQLLEDIASQVRQMEVRQLPGAALITPLDVFQAYRAQSEPVSALAVPFAVADFVDKVEAPTDAEARAYYDQYKDALPDPTRSTPGFKVPRRVQAEYAWADVPELERTTRAALPEAELREAFKARPKEFVLPPAELPVDLFGKEFADLTPPLGDPFQKVRDQVERTLAEERARDAVDEKFEAVRDEALNPFADQFLQVQEENRETKSDNPLPDPGDAFQKAASKVGLQFERTPLMTRAEAEASGKIGRARVGSTQFSDNRTFADLFFDPKTPRFDPIELIDEDGRRYLAWKTKDEEARVPPLDEVRAEVVRAWKTEKARKLAEQAARDLADRARLKGGDLRAAAGDRTVLTTDPVTRVTPSLMLGPTQVIPSKVNEIRQIPEAGDRLRDALFGLEPKQVVVAPNQPESVYYVLGLNRRDAADLNRLYDSFGPHFSIERDVMTEAQQQRAEGWMDGLRARAGLPPGWKPADEPKTASTDE